MSRRTAAVVLGLVVAVTAAPALAARRALVVGIDEYRPEGAPAGRWSNLNGAVNDAQVFAGLLTSRFGFAEGEVTTLFNQDATRERILGALEKDLYDASKSGDVVVFYYSGHGSQVTNSKSKEQDKLDESLVPADAWKGALDIRDKELGKLLTRLVKDRKVQLTAFFDSCHSGSNARGPDVARKMEPSLEDVKDPTVITPPEDVGAVIFSAAQDDELAWETQDEDGTRRGRFTLALQRALQQAVPGESNQDLFLRMRAIMSTFRGVSQEPVLAGTRGRKAQAFLGAEPGGTSSAAVRVAVRAVNGKDVELNGGRDLLLTKGSELLPLGAKAPRIRVEELVGVAKSRGKVISGDASALKPGAVLVVDRWAQSDAPALRVAVPETADAPKSLIEFSAKVERAAKQAGVALVDDPLATAPDHVLFRDGAAWTLWKRTGEKVALGESPDEGALVAALKAAAASGKNVFLQLPIPAAMAKAISVGAGTPNDAIARVPAQDADYVLVARVKEGQLQYAWARPGLSAAKSTLPLLTDWVGPGEDKEMADGLSTFAQRLAHVNGWLRLAGPPSSGLFPWRLAITQGKGKAPKQLQGGKQYTLSLVTERPPKAGWFLPRYVYAFVIDRSGASSLLYPPPNLGGVENRFPPSTDQKAPKATYPLTAIQVGEPYGLDTYVLLTTDEPLPNPGVLESEGVVSRGPEGADPLTQLLGGVGAAQRGARTPAPVEWAVDRLSLESIAPPAAQKGSP